MEAKTMKLSEKIKIALSFLTTLAPAFFGMAIWQKLPETLPIHYDYKGVPDNFADKWIAVLALPAFLFLLQAVCLVLSHIIEKDKKYSITVIIMICPFLSLVLGLATYLPVFDYEIDTSMIILCGIGIMFAVIGNILPKISRNKTMGIKLPWTLKSDVVWNKTHRLAGFMWFFGGIAVIAFAFTPSVIRLVGSLVVFVAMIALPTIYAAFLYGKEKQK